MATTTIYEPCTYLRRAFWCTDPPREIPFADLSSSLFIGNQPYAVGSLSMPPSNIDRRSWTSRRSIHAQDEVIVEGEVHAVPFFVVKDRRLPLPPISPETYQPTTVSCVGGQNMKLRHSDGPGLDVIDAQNREYIRSGLMVRCVLLGGKCL